MEGLVPSRMVLFGEGGVERVAVVTQVHPEDKVTLYVFPTPGNPLGQIATLVDLHTFAPSEHPYWRWPDRG